MRLVHLAAISSQAVEMPLPSYQEYLAEVRMNMLHSSVDSGANTCSHGSDLFPLILKWGLTAMLVWHLNAVA